MLLIRLKRKIRSGKHPPWRDMGTPKWKLRFCKPKRRAWTQKEIEYLQEHVDRMLVRDIAKHLKRTEHAVVMKMHRMGIKGIRTSTECLTVNRVCGIMGVTYRTVKRWEQHGLPIVKCGSYLHVEQNKLIRFLIDNQSLWDASKVKDDNLLCLRSDLMDIYLRKKITDAKKPYKWSSYETHKLRMMYARGASLDEISKAIGRSYSAVDCKIAYMRERGDI